MSSWEFTILSLTTAMLALGLLELFKNSCCEQDILLSATSLCAQLDLPSLKGQANLQMMCFLFMHVYTILPNVFMNGLLIFDKIKTS